MYLFDTDILSNVLKSRPSPTLLRRLAITPPENQFTTAVNIGELVYGAYRSNRTKYFLEQLESLLLPNVTVLAFDEEAARVYGKLRAELEKAGTPLSEPDMRIAAIALRDNLTLVTANTGHFARVPELTVENWLEA